MGTCATLLRQPGRGLVQLRRQAFWAAALCTAGLLSGGRAHGECLELPFADLQALAAMEDIDATQSLGKARTLIAAAQDDRTMPPLRRAALYAVAAQSSSVLELDAENRADALKGLALAPPDDNPVYLSLLISYAESVYDTPGLQQQVGKLSAVVARLPAGSIGHVCLLGTLGWMQHRLNQDELAVVTLTNAYRESAPPRLARQRARSAEALAAVMDGMGDYDQALELIQETQQWEQAHGARQSLSITRYVRGLVLLEKGDPRAALTEFDAARTMARELGDRQGIAYADLRSCEARIRQGQAAAGMADCEAARVAFAAIGIKDMVKQAQALRARADLDEGRSAAALAILNGVLDHNGADIVPHAVPDLFELRARANAA
ncbi:MAG: hypothetical protein JSR15_06735, partial [Proteobacteria bacterium]|nr:hypothetical protein [Pseudomonadota bacterium]